eukprot:s3568_g1.t2
MANVPVADLSKEQQDELLCTYAALILHDDGAEINPQNMTNLIKAAGCNVEVGMETLIKLGSGAGGGGGGGGGGGAAAAGGEGGATAGATEEKKKVEEEEEEELGSLGDPIFPGRMVTYVSSHLGDRFQRFHITWTCAGGAQQPHCIPGYCRSSSGRIECKWSKGSWKRQAAAGYYDGVRE